MPVHTDDVDCQAQPRWVWQVFCVESAVQAVKVPVQLVADGDHEQPGVVHVPCVS